MTPESIITLIAQQGGTLGLAIFAIWMLNRVWQDKIAMTERLWQEKVAQAQEYATALRELQSRTVAALEGNAEALARNTVAWEQLLKRVES